MNCMHATRLLSQAQERRLPLGQRLGLRLHLLLCGACRQFSRQLGLLRQAVRRLAGRIESDGRLTLSSVARGRIAEAMESQRQVLVEARRNPDQHFTD